MSCYQVQSCSIPYILLIQQQISFFHPPKQRLVSYSYVLYATNSLFTRLLILSISCLSDHHTNNIICLLTGLLHPFHGWHLITNIIVYHWMILFGPFSGIACGNSVLSSTFCCRNAKSGVTNRRLRLFRDLHSSNEVIRV